MTPPPPRSALVTGAAGAGIGQGISRALARQGWPVAVVDADLDAAHRLVTELQAQGAVTAAYGFDVAAAVGQDDLVAGVENDLGPVGLLVNSAGVGHIGPVGAASRAEWDRLMSVDLRGPWLLTRAVLPGMVERADGVIVNISSVQAKGVGEGYGLYGAAKSGLLGLTRGIAADYGRFGLRAVSVLPGLVDSPQSRAIFALRGDPTAQIEHYLNTRQMLPHLVTPEDVGNVVAFLGSTAAAGITGTEVVVDGGSAAMAYDRDPAPREG